MKFLVDAQLPRRLAHRLRERGHEALHTLDLPEDNRTPDAELNRLAEEHDYVLITKDADFVNSFWLRGQPPRLLLISTGNIGNDELETLLSNNLDALETLLGNSRFVELTRAYLVLHA